MKYRNGFKDLEQVQNVTGYARMYYSFTDLDRYDSAFLLNYLIDTEVSVKDKCLERGYEDYLRYSNSFIQERLNGVTGHIIVQMLNDLEEHEYIKVYHGRNKGKNARYIKLNYEKIAKALGIDELDGEIADKSSNGYRRYY